MQLYCGPGLVLFECRTTQCPLCRIWRPKKAQKFQTRYVKNGKFNANSFVDCKIYRAVCNANEAGAANPEGRNPVLDHPWIQPCFNLSCKQHQGRSRKWRNYVMHRTGELSGDNSIFL